MKHLSLSALIFAVSTLTSGCGVIFGGSRFNGTIIAKNHPDAEIYVEGKNLGRGKVIQAFPRNKPLVVELKQEGCEPSTTTFNKAFRTGNFILSVINFGVAGLIIDLSTGASFKPDHNNNPAIERMSDKNYIFIVEYPGCPTNEPVNN